MGTRLLALVAVATVAAAQENTSFESGIRGWKVGIGAKNGDQGTSSNVEIDEEASHEGRASLRLSGDAATVRWKMLTQAVPCGPGERVVLTVHARSRGLEREGNQYRNANAILIFQDARGKRLSITGTPALDGDREWVELFVHALAPPKTASVEFGVFSSMSGTAWFDAVRIARTHTEPRDGKARRAALEALRLHLARTYPFWDLRRTAPGALPIPRNTENLPLALHRMLGPLRDVHLWFETPAGRSPTVRGNRNPPNWSGRAIRKALAKKLYEGDGHLVGLIGEVGYVGIGNFERGFYKLELALDDLLAGTRALVLDVRANGGGDERLAWRIARRFVKQEVEYGFAQVRDPTVAGLVGFGPRTPRRLAPDKARTPYARPVFVLQGPYCVSSTEAFLLILGQLDNVTTVGLPSRGASGNPKPFALFDDVKVWVPTTRYLRPDRKPIEGNGIAPDVTVQESHRDGDPTLAKALELASK